MLRNRIGLDEEVIGCTDCGTVEHLVGGAIHQCDALNQPLAVTIDVTKRSATIPSPEPA